MSRPIKFRIWSVKEKKLIASGGAYVLSFRGLEFQKPHSISGINDDNTQTYFSTNTVLHSHEFVIQMMTGSKDKNGKEIYEGDIVSTIYPDDNSIGEVFFDKDTCSYRIQTREYKLPIVTARFIDDSFSHLVPVADSVLGNVFENPELLK